MLSSSILLEVTAIPFHIYFWARAPVYILFCLVPVGAGSAVMEVNNTMLYGILIDITLQAIEGKWLEKRFKSQEFPQCWQVFMVSGS